jgi:hypothetical protein
VEDRSGVAGRYEHHRRLSLRMVTFDSGQRPQLLTGKRLPQVQAQLGTPWSRMARHSSLNVQFREALQDEDRSEPDKI